MDTAAEIRKFIVDNFYVPEPDELTNEASLLDEGIVDSTGVLELITHLESTYDVIVEDTELVPENLDSINNLERFITSKSAGVLT